MLNGNLSPSENISLMSIIDAIPLEWRKIRQNAQHVPTSFRIRDTIYLYLDNFKITLLHVKVSSKLLFKASSSPTAFKVKFPHFLFDWKDIYFLLFMVQSGPTSFPGSSLYLEKVEKGPWDRG